MNRTKRLAKAGRKGPSGWLLRWLALWPAGRVARSNRLGLCRLIPWATCALCTGCGDIPDSTMPYMLNAPAGKAEGSYTCKPPVEAVGLFRPEITISIANPPMVQLRDLASDLVKYYRAGVGVMKGSESRSWEPVRSAGTRRFSVNPQAHEAGCRTRVWINPRDHNDRAPYYAGLPWLPYHGYYAIHGPIDKYWNADGGVLNPGYVSHGCIRMDAFDIRELYAHIKHKTSVPLILTKDGFGKQAEKAAYESGWIMDSCSDDYDCRALGEDHACRKASPADDTGLCTKRCSRTCPDRPERPTTFCIKDPDDPFSGYCVNKAKVPQQCKPGLTFTENVSRFGDDEHEPQSVCEPAFL